MALVLSQVHVGTPTILIGHSTGGTIAALAALARPDLVAGLVLINSGPNMAGHGAVQGMLGRLAGPTDDAMWEEFVRQNVPDGSQLSGSTRWSTTAGASAGNRQPPSSLTRPLPMSWKRCPWQDCRWRCCTGNSTPSARSRVLKPGHASFPSPASKCSGTAATRHRWRNRSPSPARWGAWPCGSPTLDSCRHATQKPVTWTRWGRSVGRAPSGAQDPQPRKG